MKYTCWTNRHGKFSIKDLETGEVQTWQSFDAFMESHDNTAFYFTEIAKQIKETYISLCD